MDDPGSFDSIELLRDQRQVYRELQGDGTTPAKPSDGTSLDSEESLAFWQGIWSSHVTNNQRVEWVTTVESDLREVQGQDEVCIFHQGRSRVFSWHAVLEVARPRWCSVVLDKEVYFFAYCNGPNA